MFGVGTLGTRITRLATIVAVVLGLGACIGPGQALPPGEYVSSDGRERITVEESRRIRFQVHVQGAKGDGMTDREYENHQVWPQSKRIQPVTMSNRDVSHGIGKYTWLWKDGRIAKTSKSGKVLAWFERQD